MVPLSVAVVRVTLDTAKLAPLAGVGMDKDGEVPPAALSRAKAG